MFFRNSYTSVQKEYGVHLNSSFLILPLIHRFWKNLILIFGECLYFFVWFFSFFKFRGILFLFFAKEESGEKLWFVQFAFFFWEIRCNWRIHRITFAGILFICDYIDQHLQVLQGEVWVPIPNFFPLVVFNTSKFGITFQFNWKPWQKHRIF